MLFDHRFDVGPLVARNQYEALDVGCDPIVLGRRKFDLLETTFIAALTMLFIADSRSSPYRQ